MVCSACKGTVPNHSGNLNHYISTCPWKTEKPQCFHNGRFIGEKYIEFLNNGGVFPTERSEEEYWRMRRNGEIISAQCILNHLHQIQHNTPDHNVDILQTQLYPFSLVRQPDPQVQEQLLPSVEEIIQSDAQVARNLQTQFNLASIYTYVNYTNNTNKTVYVYWSRGANEQLMHCCDVTKESIMINRKVTRYALNTRIIILKSPCGCEGANSRQIHRGNRIVLLRDIPSSQIIMNVKNTEQNQTITIELDTNQWKVAALRMDYMFKEMIKLGANNEKLYENIAPIVDMHQDIHIPEHTEQDKELSGIPSLLTNVT